MGLATLLLLLGIATVFLIIDKDTDTENDFRAANKRPTKTWKDVYGDNALPKYLKVLLGLKIRRKSKIISDFQKAFS